MRKRDEDRPAITTNDPSVAASPPSLGRRRFVGYLVAAPTLAVAVRLGLDETVDKQPASAAVPSVGGPAEIFDLSDMLTAAGMPTANLISLELRTDGTVGFELPRAEVGQGITTSTAMIIADELDIAVDKVEVTLAPARPELIFNQLTGGSNTTHSTYTPIRTAAAIARGRLLEAAALQLGNVPLSALDTVEGFVVGPNGAKIAYGDLAKAAASTETKQVQATLKPTSQQSVIGTAQNRVDARDAVTGKKVFAMDLDIPGALPTMVCRPPTLNGTVSAVGNRPAVLAMPGVTHVETIASGVAVRAQTFGQCIDAVRALDVTWGPGTAEGKSDADILAEVRKAQLPMLVPKVPLLTKTLDTDFTFWFASNSPLETNSAVADVRADSAEIWGSLKSPITAQEEIASKLGMPVSKVKVNVVTGGGSFGRKLFFDAALDAAEASQKMGAPVRLMWHRADDFRQGRAHPMATSRVRATVLGKEVLTWEQRHTSVKTDWGHGLGEIITATAAKLPVGDIGFSETVFALSQATHYNFGVTTQLLSEVDGGFNTGSMRNIYSPNAAVARELTVDQLAAMMKMDPLAFRKSFAYNKRSAAVLDKVAEVGDWGRSMPAGTAQGIAIHNEYHGVSACLVEIDCTPATVNRQVRDGVTGPRVTKVVFAVDVGLPINPKGLEAQMMGGIMDGIAITLTSSLHLKDGYFLEGSWDNYAYTREWNVPADVQVVVMPATSESPGGAGELGVPASAAAVATAYARATGKVPTEFPINHSAPLFFDPMPTVPPIPQSPTDGLTNY
ncbi:MAG: molybdopterin-dependent oxidoreductase [Nocardioidaceae bacterium]|nr:molybdopterin-dependent oxidoreductase [Nocardioidaceae bacterium]MCL2614862.1 molybdopterin-dependent oxidoreductase [Nocardioidaceae bacterium]